MKKTYMKPSTIEVKVLSAPLLSSSDPDLIFNPNDETTEMQSRRKSFNVWGDDED